MAPLAAAMAGAAPAGVAGVVVPGSIDSTGATNVTSSLNTWISAQPNGSRLIFPSGKTYRVDGTLYLSGRSGFTFDGTGCTITESTIGDGHQAKFRLSDCSNMTVLGFTFSGAFSTPGTIDETKQWGHAVELDGVSTGLVENITVQNLCGDGICLQMNGDGFGTTTRCTNITVRNCTINGIGRNGVSLTGADSCQVLGGSYTLCGLHGIDFEPDFSTSGVNGVTVDGAAISKYYLSGVAVVGQALVQNVTIQNVTVSGGGNIGSLNHFRFGWETLGSGDTRRFGPITVQNCTSPSTANPPIKASRIDGLTILNNTLPSSSQLLQIRGCTSVTVTGNTPNTQAAF